MSKYIKLEDAKAAFRKKYDMFNDRYEINCVLNSLPTIEASEDCISRKWLFDKAERGFDKLGEDYDINYMLRDIKNAPSVVPNRAEGKWKSEPDCGITRCIKCGWSIEECIDWNFCPNCGAKMKGADFY